MIEETLRDPSVPEETKASIRAGMESMAEARSSIRESAAADFPSENLAAVKPYMGRIEAMLETLKE